MCGFFCVFMCSFFGSKVFFLKLSLSSNFQTFFVILLQNLKMQCPQSCLIQSAQQFPSWIEEISGLPRVREKSGKNKIFSRSGNCQGILKKCQGILAI